MTTNIDRAVGVIIDCSWGGKEPSIPNAKYIADRLAAANLLAPEPHIVTSVERAHLAERLRQFAESQRMDQDSPALAAMLEEAADAVLTPAPAPRVTSAQAQSDAFWMDLWWTACGDGWAVPEDLPKKFAVLVESALAPRDSLRGATVTREQVAELMYQAMTSYDIRECALACADVAMALLTTPAEKDGAE